jgi:hypothetical protein
MAKKKVEKEKKGGKETWGEWASRKASEVYEVIPNIGIPPIQGVGATSVTSKETKKNEGAVKKKIQQSENVALLYK